MPFLPGVSSQRAIKALMKAGFRIIREGKLTIPRAHPINAYTMGGIIKDAGLSIQEFKKLL